MGLNCKNILITGGAGFIGSNYIMHIYQKYNDLKIINLDSLTYAGNTKNLDFIKDNHRYNFIKGNICDKNLVEELLKEYKIDGIINFAAETHVDNSISNPDVFVDTNINGTFNLLNNAYKYWMKGPFNFKTAFRNARFHQISTDEVFGSISKGSFKESSKYAPNSPYSASKAAADMLVRSFNKTFGLNTTISISSNNFGPNQHNEKLIPKVINCLINNKSIPIYGDGKNIRDWIYVEEHCKAIEFIFNNSIAGESYNIGSGNEFTNIDLIDLIEKIILQDKQVIKKIKFVKDRFGHDERYSLNTDKLKNELGWKIENKFTEYLSNYIKTKYNE